MSVPAEAAPGWGKGLPKASQRHCRHSSCLLPGSLPLRGSRAAAGWLSCHVIHLLEQAQDEGVEAHGVSGEFRELADLVVEAVQDLGGWAWEEDGVGDHIPNFWSPKFSLESCVAI